jgi:regulator of PEP synthase PpsR (kinase-PPPase family)
MTTQSRWRCAYTDLDALKHKVREANRAMSCHGSRTIDGSCLAIEEIARHVLWLRGRPEHTLC